jgi:hypothetical protein
MASNGAAKRRGAWVGGLVGAVSRPLVVYISWFAGATLDLGGGPGVNNGVTALVVALFAAVIGFLIGALAGWIGAAFAKPMVGSVIGALVGAALAIVSSYFTSICLCIATMEVHHQEGGHLRVDDGLYLTMMMLTGAVPGAIGGLVGFLVRRG